MSIETINPENTPVAPSAEPGKDYPNHEMLDEILNGMLETLKRHDGLKLDVTLEEVFRHTSNVSREALAYYYKDPEQIIEEAGYLLKYQARTLAEEAEDFKAQSLLMVLMEGYHRQRVAVHIFLLLGDHQIWREVLKPLFPYLLNNWTELDSQTADYLYNVYSDQLASILTIWANIDFAEEYLPSCVMLALGWLELDSMFADAHGAILAKWK